MIKVMEEASEADMISGYEVRLRQEERTGTVYAVITLRNSADVSKAEEGLIKEKDVRQTTVRALVDTGAGTIVISEELCQQLGLRIEGLRSATLANNSRQVCKRTAPVQIQWKERTSSVNALVVPDTNEVLLGAIPLEDMDIMVSLSGHELVGAHGDTIVCMLK
jgi:clan AA aspartic protease